MAGLIYLSFVFLDIFHVSSVAYNDKMFNVLHGQALGDSVIYVWRAHSLIKCATRCLSDPLCDSVNFDLSGFSCEFNGYSTNGEISTRENWVHLSPMREDTHVMSLDGRTTAGDVVTTRRDAEATELAPVTTDADAKKSAMGTQGVVLTRQVTALTTKLTTEGIVLATTGMTINQADWTTKVATEGVTSTTEAEALTTRTQVVTAGMNAGTTKEMTSTMGGVAGTTEEVSATTEGMGTVGKTKTTERLVATTEGTIGTTEEPVVTTVGSVVTTEGPVVATEGQEVTTEGHVVTTEGRVVTTERPAGTTEGQEVATEVQGVTTVGHVVTTEGQEETTEGSVVTTERQVMTTEGQGVTTGGPVVTTGGDVVTTEGPVVTTEGPVVTTEGQGVTTEGLVGTTEEQGVTTEGHGQTTVDGVQTTNGTTMTTTREVTTEGVRLTTASERNTVTTEEAMTTAAGYVTTEMATTVQYVTTTEERTTTPLATTMKTITECGTYTEGGIIRTPGYPWSTPHNLNCFHIFEAPVGRKVLVVITDLELAGNGVDSRDCRDKFKLSDGLQGKNKIEHMCGGVDFVAPQYFISTDRWLRTQLTTDETAISKGVEMEVRFIADDCGSAIHLNAFQSMRSVRSPGYDYGYPVPRDLACQINITATSFIEISFDFLNTECPNRLRLYDGLSSNSPLLARKCGEHSGVTFTTSGNELRIELSTGSGINSRGFSAAVETINPPSEMPVTAGPTLSTVHAIDVCGTIRVEGVSITPGYPGSTPHDLDCTKLLEAPVGKKVYLVVTDLELAGDGIKSARCPDKFKLADGIAGGGTSIAYMCSGNDFVPPGFFMSTGRWMRAVLTTDDSDVSKGVEMDVRFISDDCGTVINLNEVGSMRTMRSPGQEFGYMVPHNVTCQIDVTATGPVQITFDSFFVDCSDNLKVYDGLSMDSVSLVDNCGDRTGAVYTSSGPQLRLVLTTDGSVYSQGFSATVTTA